MILISLSLSSEVLQAPLSVIKQQLNTSSNLTTISKNQTKTNFSLHLYESCQITADCKKFTNHSTCDLSSFSCKCDEKFVAIITPLNKTCVSFIDPKVGTRPEHVLPALIMMFVMFLGICIALNLFSRADKKKQEEKLRPMYRKTNLSSASKRYLIQHQQQIPPNNSEQVDKNSKNLSVRFQQQTSPIRQDYSCMSSTCLSPKNDNIYLQDIGRLSPTTPTLDDSKHQRVTQTRSSTPVELGPSPQIKVLINADIHRSP